MALPLIAIGVGIVGGIAAEKALDYFFGNDGNTFIEKQVNGISTRDLLILSGATLAGILAVRRFG